MLKRDNTRNRFFLPVLSILLLFICIGGGCKQPQAVSDPATQIQPQPEVQPEPQPTPNHKGQK